MNAYAQRVLENLKNAAPWETEFLQSVTEVFESLGKILDVNPKYEKNKILERITVQRELSLSRFPGLMTRERSRSITATASSSTVPSGRIKAGFVSVPL